MEKARKQWFAGLSFVYTRFLDSAEALPVVVDSYSGRDCQGDERIIVELAGTRKRLHFRAVNAEAERLIEADCRVDQVPGDSKKPRLEVREQRSSGALFMKPS